MNLGIIAFCMCEDFWVSQACVSVVVLLIVKGWLRWLKRRHGVIVGVLGIPWNS